MSDETSGSDSSSALDVAMGKAKKSTVQVPTSSDVVRWEEKNKANQAHRDRPRHEKRGRPTDLVTLDDPTHPDKQRRSHGDLRKVTRGQVSVGGQRPKQPGGEVNIVGKKD